MKPLAKRSLVFLLLLLVLGTAFSAAAFTAAAEGGEGDETTTFRDPKTGIEADIKTSALPANAKFNVVVNRTTTGEYLDPGLYWQPFTLIVKGDSSNYEGTATVRIYFDVNITDNSVERVIKVAIVEKVDPENPPQPTDVSFSVENDILTMEVELPAIVYIGSTGGHLVTMPGDYVDNSDSFVSGEGFLGWVDDMRDAFWDWENELWKPAAQKFNEFLRDDWTWMYNFRLAPLVENIYTVLYPFGVFILILSWAGSVTASGFSLDLDPRNKYSIFRAIMRLLVGIALLSATPKLLSVIMSFCNQIRLQIVENFEVRAGHSFILFVFKLKILLNLAHIALLQSISPLFVGTAAGSEGVRRFSISFFKEYALRCIELTIVTIYILFIDALEELFDLSGNILTGNILGLSYSLIAWIALSLSVFMIDKKFEKLFH